MALDPTSIATLATLNSNVNAADVVQRYTKAIQGRTVIAPQGVQQIGAFAFDYIGDERVRLEVDAPDHYLEDNRAVGDHLARKPYIVTLRGYVAELRMSGELFAAINAVLNAATATLAQVPNYVGALSQGGVEAAIAAISQAQNVVEQIEQAAARADQLAQLLLPNPAMNRQQQAYFQLSALAEAGVVFTVQTPFQTFDNMVIIGLDAVQPKQTLYWSEFEVTMKQLRFVGQNSSASSALAKNTGRLAAQISSMVSNGATAGVAAVQSVLSDAFNGVSAVAAGGL